MKLGVIIYSDDAELVWNAFRLGVFARLGFFGPFGRRMRSTIAGTPTATPTTPARSIGFSSNRVKISGALSTHST